MCKWQTIDTVPVDGALVDLWHDEKRYTDCFWNGGMWKQYVAYNLIGCVEKRPGLEIPQTILVALPEFRPTHWMRVSGPE